MSGMLVELLSPLMGHPLMAPLRAAGPLEQFEIIRLIRLPISGEPFDISITNSTVWMFIAVGMATLLLTLATRRLQLVPGGMQSLGEMTYEFVAKMLRDAVGDEGRALFPYIFTLFVFIFLANILGLLPTIPGTPEGLHVFTPTSHIIVTFALASLSVGIVVVIGFMKNGLGFLKLFAPSGIPLLLMPLIVPIEVVSFLSRPISLGVRLFANMLAGHIVLKVFAGFVVTLFGAGGALAVISIIPFFGIVIVFFLELLVAFLQAFVFAVLSCIYLSDALHPSHH
ncbi:Fo ATP synthase subunit A [Parvularcula bermudensis HTCC2503]|uniref:ATP synthase subunit a n=2 Tax=Parvularcula TaxID=208215 RepID=E0TC72_PARBH|nr:F0F1 ATP synthase subunit A [Parvularcula bermudensis]ADM08505.1 Fo ATP synthase subunit A [Parvularcula bermudensis HTCC2503]